MRGTSLRRLDAVERALVVAACVASMATMVPDFVRRPALGTSLVLVPDLVVVGFVVFRRRPEEISVRPSDWVVSLFSTVMPLLARPADGPSLIPQPVAALVVLAGLLLSLAAKLSLRRSFSIVPARGVIVCHGPYKLVRHPMYTGYVVTFVGVLCFGFVWWNLACYLICWISLWIRIGREETLLSKDDGYRSYCSQVPYRLVRGLL